MQRESNMSMNRKMFSLKKLNRIAFTSLLTIMFLFVIKTVNAKAEAFTYYNYTSGKNVNYNGTSPKYVLNGHTIDMGEEYSIIDENGNALASAGKLLGEGLGMDVSYNASLNRLTIKYNNQTMILYTNKTTGQFNGIEITPKARPIRIKYENGPFATLIPTRYVCDRFGIGYVWNSASGTVTLTSPKKLRKDGELFYYHKKLCNVTLDGKTLDLGGLSGYLIDDTSVVPAKAVFANFPNISYKYISATGAITIKCEDITIKMTIGSTQTIVNGIVEDCPYAPCKIYDYDTKTTLVYIPPEYVFKTLGYGYSFKSATYSCGIKTTGSIGKYTVSNAPFLLADSELEGIVPLAKQELNIPIPDGITEDQLNITEYSNLNQITLTIPGDHRDFYKKNIFKNTGEAILQVQFLYNDNKTMINLFVRKNSEGLLMTYKGSFENGIYKMIIDRPKNLYDKVIVIDAGHGANDPGTSNFGYSEKNLNLSYATVSCKKYFDQTDIKVIFTRSNDTFLPLSERAGFADRCQADFFISIHMNNNEKEYCNGTSIYSSKTNKAKGPNGLTGPKMATQILPNLLTALGSKDMGSQFADFDVLVYNTVPAVLIEVGFMSNEAEVNNLISKEYQDKFGKALCEACIEIYDKYFE